MKILQLLANQLSNPRGMIGSAILGPMWNRRNAALNDFTLAQLNPHENERVLEVGFGGGYLLGRLLSVVTKGWVVGVDVSRAMALNGQVNFHEAICKRQLALCLGRAEALPFADEQFTSVCSVNSIFYWDEALRGLVEIFRVLRSPGKLVLTFTAKKDLEKKWFIPYGVKPYSGEELKAMLETAGFSQCKMERGEDRHREFFSLMGWK